MDIDSILATTNLAEGLEDTTLKKIGQDVVDGYKADCNSREEWERKNEQWVRLATQFMEKKTFPWPNAANVKFPLLTTAAMQFSARAYPALVPSQSIVVGKVVGKDDEQQSKRAKAERIGMHMSYQLLEQMEDWEEDMDKLCLTLPIVGTCFKKTYFDPVKGKNCSELVLAKDLVVNYWAKTLETAFRKTHVFELNANQIQEKKNAGVYRDVVLSQPSNIPTSDANSFNKWNRIHPPQTDDESTPYSILEQHTFLDLDGDGYKEPYIVTVERESGTVLRILARFYEKDVKKGANGKIIAIKPFEYFTKYGFIPNPDGGFYDLGFGVLLGGVNETVNTLINQLLDAGTLSNLQSGFISKGIRIRGGNKPLTPGEWRTVETTGDDLKKGIVPLPAKDPSTTLFQLLGTLVTSGKELASIAEIFVGKMPGQNTPATTTMASIEQGQKVFVAIYKRILRSLSKELKKLYRLNSIYLEDMEYFTILDDQGVQQSLQTGKKDYEDESLDVIPSADPNVVSDAQKLIKAQGLMELIPLGTVNPQEATKRILEAQGQVDIATLMQVQPQPNPEAQKMQMEMQIKQQEAQMKMQMEQMKAQLDAQAKQMELQFKQKELEMKEREMMINMQVSQMESRMNLQASAIQHSQKIAQNDATHKQKLAQTKESNANSD